MTARKFEIIDVFREKNLSEVISTYRSANPRPSNDVKASLLVMLGGFLIVYLGMRSNYSTENLFVLAGYLIGFSLSFCAASVGILIAGFSIVASALDVKVFRELASMPYPNEESERSTLVVMFASFVFMILIFLKLFSLCLLFYVLFSKEGLVWSILGDEESFCKSTTMIFLNLLLSFNAFALLSVRTFLWNLYQMLLVVGVAKVIIEESKK